ncbi:unnamed protein product [Parnassius apollo]|uniref:(apollo) hypothetical protein n=1 Tax=Parnassius apollo TaxID=110799 RepID=A0A8S3X1T2_PARAO|nr:unnamed protein product [Parnassius apollo]
MEKYKNYKTSEGDKQAGSESDASLCSDVSRTASKSGGRSRGAKKRRITKSISSSDNEAFLKETNSETGKEVTPLMDNSGEFVVPGPEEALSMAERQVEQMAENTCLRSEIEELRKELSEIRLEMARINKTPAPPTPQVRGDKESEELISSIMRQVGDMMNARLEALEERLLPEKRVRPPLAADVRRDVVNDADILRRKSDTITKADKYAVKTRIGNKKIPTLEIQRGNRKGKGHEGRTTEMATNQPTESRPQPPESTEEGWTTVVRRVVDLPEPFRLNPNTNVPAPGVPQKQQPKFLVADPRWPPESGYKRFLRDHSSKTCRAWDLPTGLDELHNLLRV